MLRLFFEISRLKVLLGENDMSNQNYRNLQTYTPAQLQILSIIQSSKFQLKLYVKYVRF